MTSAKRATGEKLLKEAKGVLDGQEPVAWPERLTLRDTRIHADEGQRIYTTATGYGYEKREYVRADLAASPLPQGDETLVDRRDIYECANQLGGYVDPGTPEHLAKFLLREAEAASALADTIVAQAAEIAGLKAELSECRVVRDSSLDVADQCTASMRAAEAKLASAMEALEPFAKEARAWPDHVWGGHGLGNALSVSVTIGDLRRARTTLSSLKGGADE